MAIPRDVAMAWMLENGLINLEFLGSIHACGVDFVLFLAGEELLTCPAVVG